MSPYLSQYKKNIAKEMRMRGMSYSEISNRIHVSISTLSYWLKKIKISDELRKKIEERKSEAIKSGLNRRIEERKNEIEKIRIEAAKNISNISKRELWLMGIMLYWRERFLSGNDTDLKKGVKFTSSDPYLIKFFIKWLKDVGGILREEITFDLFLKHHEKKNYAEAVRYWSEVVGLPDGFIANTYYLKDKDSTRIKNKNHLRRSHPNTRFGFLRVRVKASSMLARQIMGWVRGIIKYYWD